MDKTVLVIDDNREMRRLLEVLLSRSGWTVLHAVNGLSAMRLVNDHGDRLALVISDVLLPDITGTDLMEALVNLKPGLHGLLITGDPDVVPADCPWSVLGKPFSMGELAATIQRVCQAQPFVPAPTEKPAGQPAETPLPAVVQPAETPLPAAVQPVRRVGVQPQTESAPR